MNKVNLNIAELDQELLVSLDQYIDETNAKEGNLIHVLHKAQELFGYIPTNLQLHIARKLNIGAAKVNGVVSFYSYFSQEKTGKNIVSVCLGTACYVKGAEKIVKEFLKELGVEKEQVTEDGLFSVRDVRCVGACGLAPVVTVGEKVYGHVKQEDVKSIIKEFRGESS
jgi:NADH:ubiquinone oxidoreductase subunit E